MRALHSDRQSRSECLSSLMDYSNGMRRCLHYGQRTRYGGESKVHLVAATTTPFQELINIS